MKTISKKYFTIIFILSMVIASHSLAQHQHGSDSTKTDMKKKNCCKTMSSSNQEMKSEKTEMKEQNKIDLQMIDKNRDGKVFQDPMDWNVISDVPGKCPLCKMTLKEVTVKEAKENLIKNGFKVK